ncbi:MAG: hypothetical protein QM594_03480 [Niabella sp.]
MKSIYFLLIAGVLFVSCASSQTNTEAKTKINEWRSLLKLSPEQVTKLETVESDYLAKMQKLKTADKKYNDQLSRLKQKRDISLQRILSREQYIKFQALEDNRIKRVPIRL